MRAKGKNAELVLAFFFVVASIYKSVHLVLKCKGKNKMPLWNHIDVKKSCCGDVWPLTIKTYIYC